MQSLDESKTPQIIAALEVLVVMIKDYGEVGCAYFKKTANIRGMLAKVMGVLQRENAWRELAVPTLAVVIGLWELDS